MLDDVVEFVGEENVVQVVTDNAQILKQLEIVDAEKGVDPMYFPLN